MEGRSDMATATVSLHQSEMAEDGGGVKWRLAEEAFTSLSLILPRELLCKEHSPCTHFFTTHLHRDRE